TYDNGVDVLNIAKSVRVPFIATRRPTWEGGHSTEDTPTRIRWLRAWSAVCQAVDIELKSLDAYAKDVPLNQTVIVSVHDFKERPPRLYNLIGQLNDAPGTVNKIVWMARSIRDNLEAFEILQNRQKPTIALCMGEAGLISRVL